MSGDEKNMKYLIGIIIMIGIIIIIGAVMTGYKQQTPCPTILDYVCGNDGKTYDNECLARTAGTQTAYEGKCLTEEKNEKSCDTDADCACGKHINTGDCFYGNKAYVNTLEQCPDFCGGIAGNLEVRCINKKCLQQQR